MQRTKLLGGANSNSQDWGLGTWMGMRIWPHPASQSWHCRWARPPMPLPDPPSSCPSQLAELGWPYLGALGPSMGASAWRSQSWHLCTDLPFSKIVANVLYCAFATTLGQQASLGTLFFLNKLGILNYPIFLGMLRLQKNDWSPLFPFYIRDARRPACAQMCVVLGACQKCMAQTNNIVLKTILMSIGLRFTGQMEGYTFGSQCNRAHTGSVTIPSLSFPDLPSASLCGCS